MSCDCHKQVGETPNGSAIVLKKKPCGPCAQAAAAMASTVPVAQGGTRVAGIPGKRTLGAASYTLSSTSIGLMVLGAAAIGVTVGLVLAPKRKR